VDLEAFLWVPDQWDQGGEIVFAVGGPPNGLDLAHARCQQSGSCVDLGALVGLLDRRPHLPDHPPLPRV